MIRNVLLTIEYDGTGFSGWQRQPGKRTVQGELERVLGTLCACDMQLNGVSRTDAGVHALGQRASFKGEFAIPTENIKRAANDLLAAGSGSRPGDARIVDVAEVPADFHARFDAVGKKYIYRICTDSNMGVFERNYCYRVKETPDTERMRQAAALIVGTHDFKCFQAAGGEEKKTTVRTISSLEIISEHQNITVEVKGDGFLYNMVRIIVGTLIDVGSGKMSVSSVATAIESLDRQRAGHTAPPQGLYLAEVYY